jgi:CBS domain-containing protein
VVEWDGRLVGLVSEADVLGDPLYTQGPRRTVGDVMTHAPITVDVDATVGAARDLIADRGLRLLPVVKEGVAVGVVGRSDLV